MAHDVEDFGVGVWEADLAVYHARDAVGDVEDAGVRAEEEVVDVEALGFAGGADDEANGRARAEAGGCQDWVLGLEVVRGLTSATLCRGSGETSRFARYEASMWCIAIVIWSGDGASVYDGT